MGTPAAPDILDSGVPFLSPGVPASALSVAGKTTWGCPQTFPGPQLYVNENSALLKGRRGDGVTVYGMAPCSEAQCE